MVYSKLYLFLDAPVARLTSRTVVATDVPTRLVKRGCRGQVGTGCDPAGHVDDSELRPSPVTQVFVKYPVSRPLGSTA